MLELRRFKRDILNYEYLLSTNQDKARANAKEYLDEIKLTEKVIEECIDIGSEELIKWCTANIEVFAIEYTDNMLDKIIIFLYKKIIDYHTNKISYQLSEFGILQEKILRCKIRFEQYNSFCK